MPDDGIADVTSGKNAKTPAADADTYEMLNLFGEVMERAKVSYVEDVTDKKLIESAINGDVIGIRSAFQLFRRPELQIHERTNQRQIRRFGN